MDYDPIDAQLAKLVAAQLADLDRAHMRAQSPKVRMLLEKRMTKLKADLEDIRMKAKIVDLAYERWKRDLKQAVEEVAGEPEPK
jgi:hypothetical protein